MSDPVEYRLEIYGEPKGQPRVKAFARKFGDGRIMARVYTPGTAENWKSQIAIAAREQGLAHGGLLDAISIIVDFEFQRPRSHFGTGRNASMMKPSAPKYHTGRPDLDNLVKAFKDALTTIGAWKNDSQVVRCEAEKSWGDNHRTVATIYALRH